MNENDVLFQKVTQAYSGKKKCLFGKRWVSTSCKTTFNVLRTLQVILHQVPTGRMQITWQRLATKMASRQGDLQDVFQYLDVEERKKVLARVLKFPEFNEEDDLRTAILLDVYYEMLSYFVNSGVPWREVALFFAIFKRSLQKTQGKDYSHTM